MTKREFKIQILNHLADQGILPSDVGKMVKAAATKSALTDPTEWDIPTKAIIGALMLPVGAYFGSKAIGGYLGGKTSEFFNPYPFEGTEIDQLSKQELLDEYANQISRIKERQAIKRINEEQARTAEKKKFLQVRGQG
jgi:hypothetical protein